jgi:phospholipid transport system substrate-binding protein
MPISRHYPPGTWRAHVFFRFVMDKSIAAALMLFSSLTGSPAASPREVVQVAVERVVSVLEHGEPGRDRGDEPPFPADSRTRTALRRIAGDLFDFDEMARRTLSRHWTGRTRAEHAEFVGLFTDLLERSYVARIESYAGEKINYLGEKVDGDFAVVRSRIVAGRGRADTAVDYRLLRRDGRWKVYDVLVDGVSFVSTYRSQFNRVIAGSSYGALVEAIRRGRLPIRTAERRP